MVDDGLPYRLGSLPTGEEPPVESGLPLPELSPDHGVRLTGRLPWAEDARLGTTSGGVARSR